MNKRRNAETLFTSGMAAGTKRNNREKREQGGKIRAVVIAQVA